MSARVPLSARLLPGLRSSLRTARADLRGNLASSKSPSRPLGGAPFRAGSPPALGGSITRGQAVRDGTFSHFAQTVTAPPDALWSTPLPSERFAAWLHGFGWLEDLAALSDSEAVSRIASLYVDAWATEYGRYNRFVWQPRILARRLVNALAFWSPLLDGRGEGGGADARQRVLTRQARYLRASAARLPPGLDQIRGGVVLALFALRANDEDALSHAQAVLGDHLSAQILPDGAHISRSPEATLDALTLLRALDRQLEHHNLAAPSAVSRAMDRMAPMIAFFSHTDGGLAAFHGGGEGDVGAVGRITATLASKPFAFAPHSRFQRVDRDGTVLLMDVGGAAPFPFDGEAHLAPLAFELSTPEGRLIVNCGWSPDQPEAWRAPMRRTAAHSTLDVAGVDAGRVGSRDDIAIPYAGEPVLRDSGPVQVERRDADIGVIIEGTHNGFLPAAGAIHRRRIFVNEAGDDIRGEDALVPGRDAMEAFDSARDVCLRFHLHPDVAATPSADGRHVRLDLPDGGAWVFLSTAAREGFSVGLEESAYLGTGDRPLPTRQIVLRGRADARGDLVLKWAIKRADTLVSASPPAGTPDA